MEADLRAVYHVDYRDRWRTGDHGRPRLTLRMLAVMVRHLPADSATTTIRRGSAWWRPEAHLLDDIRIATLAGLGVKNVRPHPQRPSPVRRIDPARKKKFAAAAQRAADRRRRIESGELA